MNSDYKKTYTFSLHSLDGLVRRGLIRQPDWQARSDAIYMSDDFYIIRSMEGFFTNGFRLCPRRTQFADLLTSFTNGSVKRSVFQTDVHTTYTIQGEWIRYISVTIKYDEEVQHVQV